MPEGSKVHKLFVKLKGKGHSVESAAKIAQAKTGQALQTGRPPKRMRVKMRKKM